MRSRSVTVLCLGLLGGVLLCSVTDGLEDAGELAAQGLDLGDGGFEDDEGGGVGGRVLEELEADDHVQALAIGFLALGCGLGCHGRVSNNVNSGAYCHNVSSRKYNVHQTHTNSLPKSHLQLAPGGQSA